MTKKVPTDVRISSLKRSFDHRRNLSRWPVFSHFHSVLVLSTFPFPHLSIRNWSDSFLLHGTGTIVNVFPLLFSCVFSPPCTSHYNIYIYFSIHNNEWKIVIPLLSQSPHSLALRIYHMKLLRGSFVSGCQWRTAS